jgi:hypothetical protein
MEAALHRRANLQDAVKADVTDPSPTGINSIVDGAGHQHTRNRIQFPRQNSPGLAKIRD